MNNEKVEVNGRIFEKEFLKKAIKICEDYFIDFEYSHKNFSFLYWVCGLNEDELNKLFKHLEEMKDILLKYYTDLNKAMEENNE